ncbi:MAG: hypothetical protein KDB88_14225, partial [Flavobacteriales bacterium]|nr:hypothetical protein [Flavobacteriales bacterium]
MRSWLAFFVLLFACAQAPQPTTGPDVGWQQVDLAHAEHFELWERDGDRKLIVFGAGGHADTLAQFVMLRDSASRTIGNEVVLAAPLQRLVLRSSTHLGYLNALEVMHYVQACSRLDAIRDTAMLEAAKRAGVVPLFDGPSAQQEQLLQLAPDAVLDVPFGSLSADRGTWIN